MKQSLNHMHLLRELSVITDNAKQINNPRKFVYAGTRGSARSLKEANKVFKKIPFSIRASGNTEQFLKDKHWSHKIAYSNGGTNSAVNGVWEKGKNNISRGNKKMTSKENLLISTGNHLSGLAYASKHCALIGLKSFAISLGVSWGVSLMTSLVCKQTLELKLKKENIKESAKMGIESFGLSF